MPSAQRAPGREAKLLPVLTGRAHGHGRDAPQGPGEPQRAMSEGGRSEPRGDGDSGAPAGGNAGGCGPVGTQRGGSGKRRQWPRRGTRSSTSGRVPNADSRAPTRRVHAQARGCARGQGACTQRAPAACERKGVPAHAAPRLSPGDPVLSAPSQSPKGRVRRVGHRGAVQAAGPEAPGRLRGTRGHGCGASILHEAKVLGTVAQPRSQRPLQPQGQEAASPVRFRAVRMGRPKRRVSARTCPGGETGGRCQLLSPSVRGSFGAGGRAVTRTRPIRAPVLPPSGGCSDR